MKRGSYFMSFMTGISAALPWPLAGWLKIHMLFELWRSKFLSQ